MFILTATSLRNNIEERDKAQSDLTTARISLSDAIEDGQSKQDIIDRLQNQVNTLISQLGNREGGKTTSLEDFLFDMEIKLRTNNDHFANANDKLSYFITRLKGVARQQFLPYKNDDGSFGIQDVDAAINILRTAFDATDTPAISQSKLFAIAQGNQPLNIFLAE
ncbi:hypothetical protein BJ878DRAFT_545508 [Calycina marina]|uniref:Uncharacterized protein n=1 Tax=Calycina marina TaxID=1763456 RepID=A0A9P7YWX8_9HELO|nr:hypothetical protein BJ878DRAFT_545508 [Calycina marina]